MYFFERKQYLNVFSQVCAFRADHKSKIAALTSNWLRHFRVFLWNCCWNSMKLERNQDQGVPYKVCIFRTDEKTRMAVLASDWLIHFPLLLTRLIRKQDLKVLCQVYFLWADRKKPRWPSWRLFCWDTFYFFFKPRSDIRCNRFATSPRLTIYTNRRGRNKVPDRSRRGCREVGDWSATSLRPNQSQTGFCACTKTKLRLIWSQKGPGKVADQSPISRRLVADRLPTNPKCAYGPYC